LFELDLEKQLKIWIAFGLIIYPLAGIIFGLVLKFVVKKYLHISLSIGRSIFIQVVASFYCWLALGVFFAGSQVAGGQSVWQTINGVTTIFITGYCYSKMVKQQAIDSIGFPVGLKLSAIMTAIAIIIMIPINLMRA